MAIGENSYFNSGSDTNATRKSTLEFSYYSRYSFLSTDKSVSLRFEFRSGLMQCKMYTKSGEAWNNDPTEIIYLSPTKAAMLVEQIDKFKEYMHNSKKIDENVAFGVNGGMSEKVSFIAFHTNQERNVLITIGKFDGAGIITEKVTMESSFNFNYGLDWKNLDKMELDKAYYNYVELDMIQKAIADFARGMSGAIGYGVHDTGRYDLGRILNRMDPIYDKLGIERIQGSYQRNRGTNNFLNNMNGDISGSSFAGSTQSEHTSIDDLLGM